MCNILYVKRYLLTKQRLIRLKLWKLGYCNFRIIVGKEKQFYIKSKSPLKETKNIAYQALDFIASRYPDKVEDWKIKRIKTQNNKDIFHSADEEGNLHLKFEVNLLPSDLITTSQNDVLVSVLLKQILRKFNIELLPEVYLSDNIYPCGGHVHYSFLFDGNQNFLHLSDIRERFDEFFNYYYQKSLSQNLTLIAPSKDSFQRLFCNKLVKISTDPQKTSEQAIHKEKLGICHRNIGTDNHRLEIRSISGGIPVKLNGPAGNIDRKGGSNPYLANVFVLNVIDKAASTILADRKIDISQEDFLDYRYEITPKCYKNFL